MRTKCCVYGCKSATYNTHGYMHLFHRFPKNFARRKIWTEFCKNPALSFKSTQHICSLHFEKTMYSNNLLTRYAIPTLNPPTVPNKRLDVWNNDEGKASVAVANSKAEHVSSNDNDSGQKQLKPTEIKVIESFVKEEEDDCESVTFISEDEGSEEEVLNTDEDNPIPDFIKEEYEPIPSTSKGPVVVGSKLSLGNNSVEPIYKFMPEYESLPASSIQTKSVLPQISNVRSEASYAPVANIDLDDDDCATFAAHIKARMRNFNPEQKIIAQKLISDILFMADMQQLQTSSTVVHNQTTGLSNEVPAVKRQKKGSFLAYLDSENDSPSTSKKKK